MVLTQDFLSHILRSVDEPNRSNCLSCQYNSKKTTLNKETTSPNIYLSAENNLLDYSENTLFETQTQKYSHNSETCDNWSSGAFEKRSDSTMVSRILHNMGNDGLRFLGTGFVFLGTGSILFFLNQMLDRELHLFEFPFLRE